MKALVVCTCIAVMIAAALVVVKLEASGVPTTAQSVAAAAPASQPKQLWTCGMHPWVIQDHPGICPICHMKLTPMKMDGGGSGSGIRIDPAIVQNMGVTTARVVRGPITVTVRAIGTLEVPEPAQHDVTLKVNGYIEKLYADTEGMEVAKGQVLFDIYSPDLQLAEQELIAAVEGLKALDAHASDAIRNDAQNLVDSAKQKLRLWDVAEQDIETIASAKIAPTRSGFCGSWAITSRWRCGSA
jgi:membrane fusion protein, copper/silver efflux system